jgi:hypothetical protein
MPTALGYGEPPNICRMPSRSRGQGTQIICVVAIRPIHSRQLPAKERLGRRFSMSVVFERKSLAASMLRNGDNCPRAKKPGENGGAGSGSLAIRKAKSRSRRPKRSETVSRCLAALRPPAQVSGSTFSACPRKALGMARRSNARLQTDPPTVLSHRECFCASNCSE